MARKPRKKRQPARGTLMIISVLMIGSAVMRVGLNATQAIAKETPAQEVSEIAPAPVMACDVPPDFQEMLTAFQRREDRIERREAAIKDRMQALSIADERVSAKLEELRLAEDALRQTIALADTAAEDDISRLTTVYENMKPKDAAALFEEMNPEFAAGFLARMTPQSAAGVMAGLQPQTAYSISAILAGRNANVPSE